MSQIFPCSSSSTTIHCNFTCVLTRWDSSHMKLVLFVFIYFSPEHDSFLTLFFTLLFLYFTFLLFWFFSHDSTCNWFLWSFYVLLVHLSVWFISFAYKNIVHSILERTTRTNKWLHKPSIRVKQIQLLVSSMYVISILNENFTIFHSRQIWNSLFGLILFYVIMSYTDSVPDIQSSLPQLLLRSCTIDHTLAVFLTFRNHCFLYLL